MKFSKSNIKKILVVTLSNIGDVILTFPVIDVLRRDFPSAELDVVVGPKAAALFQGNPQLAKVFIFDKRQPALKTLALCRQLRKERFDLAIDLRNTALPFIIGARCRTPLEMVRKTHLHMRQKHLNRLKSVFDYHTESPDRYVLYIPEDEQKKIDLLLRWTPADDQKVVVVGPGAANHNKRWTEDGFAQVCDQLTESYRVKIVFVGDQTDAAVVESVRKKMRQDSLNFCGKTSLIELAALLRRSSLAVVNDSAIMHMASYLQIPVLALFGPTDPRKYGPWSPRHCVIKKDVACPACQQPVHPQEHICLKSITAQDVLKTIQLNGNGFDFQQP